jgi:hypothetical protein
MRSASWPPIPEEGPDDLAGKIRGWVGGLIDHASLLLLEGDDDDREGVLAKLSVARFLELHAAELQKRFADRAQERGATDAALAHATGLREQTVVKKHPNRHRTAGGSGAPAGINRWRSRRG